MERSLQPHNQIALLYRGLAEIKLLAESNASDEAQWKAARAFIVKANRADPENPYPLFFYYVSFLEQGTVPNPIARDGLTKAFSLAPQDPRIRIAYVQLMMFDGKLAIALELLKPMAFDPHGGSIPEWARSMMTGLEKAIQSGEPFNDYSFPTDEGPQTNR